ncbi:MAG: alpha/beta fold hydrolase, partial [Myxococcota bacterium]
LRSSTVPDGTALTYRVWPASGPARARVGLFNGIMSHSAWFGPLAGGLTDAGLRLIGLDRRGSGLNEAGRGDAPAAGVLVDDALALLDAEADETPLFLVGWCWGAALATAVAHALGDRVAGLVLVTPGMFNRPALHAAVEAQSDRIAAAAPEAAVIDSPIDDTMFTRSDALDTFVRADPHRVQTISPRMLAVTKKLATAATIRLRKLSVPVLVLLAEDDEATDNEATEAYFAKLPAERVRVERVPGHHGVQFDAPAETTAAINAFIAAHLP